MGNRFSPPHSLKNCGTLAEQFVLTQREAEALAGTLVDPDDAHSLIAGPWQAHESLAGQSLKELEYMPRLQVEVELGPYGVRDVVYRCGSRR